MFKKLIFISLFFFCGCIADKSNDSENYSEENAVIFSTNFNEEHYIWESFLFPTNINTK